MNALLLALLIATPQTDEIRVGGPDEIIVETGLRQEWADGVGTFTGNPVVTYRDVRFEALGSEGTIVYDETTGNLTAGEFVSFRRGEENLTGRELDFNAQTMSGTIADVTGQLASGVLVRAALARRLETGLYELTDVTIITCDSEGEPILTSTHAFATIDPEEYVRASQSLFKVKGIPVFWLPYFSAPLEGRPRSSGFLLPRTSTSTTKGRSISESYYYVINRSADATLTAEYFSKRGMAGAATFRAVPNESSNVEVNSFFAPDRLGEGGHSTSVFGTTRRGGLRGVADLNVISSLTFRQVFGEGFDLISSPTETSRAFASYNVGPASYNFLYSRQGTFFVDQPATIVRKLPSFDMGVYSHPLGGLPVYLSFDGSVAGIHRRDGARQAPAFVGRVDVYPRIEWPVLRGPAFGWVHTVGIRNTHYSHRAGGPYASDGLNRFAFEYGFDFSGPRIEGLYGTDWKHVVEPYVEYRYVSGVDRFPDTLQIDEIDLFADTNEVRYGIVNRLFRDREILSWSLSQKYFSDPTFGGALVPGRDNVFEPLLDLTGFGFGDEPRRFSPLVSRLSYAPGGGTNADLQLDYDTARSRFKSMGLIGRQQVGVAFYSLAYFYTRESTIQERSNQVRGTLGWGDNTRAGLNAAFSFAYNVDRAFFQTTTAQLSYNTACYGLHLEFMQFDVGARRENRFRFSFTLDDLGSIGTLRRQDLLF